MKKTLEQRVADLEREAEKILKVIENKVHDLIKKGHLTAIIRRLEGQESSCPGDTCPENVFMRVTKDAIEAAELDLGGKTC